MNTPWMEHPADQCMDGWASAVECDVCKKAYRPDAKHGHPRRTAIREHGWTFTVEQGDRCDVCSTLH